MCGVGYRLETSNVAEDSGNGLVTAAGAGAQEEQEGALLVHETPQDWLALGDTGVACVSLPGTHKIFWGAKFLEKRGYLTNEP